MPTDAHRASCFPNRLLRDHTADELRERLTPKKQAPAQPVLHDPDLTREAVEGRWPAFAARPENRAALLDPETLEQMERCRRN